MNDEYSEIGDELRHHRWKVVNVLKILAGVLILLLIIEILGTLVGYFTEKPVVAQWGTMEKGFWAETLFLRDESILTAPVGGELSLKLDEGIRTPHGEIVAVIDTTDSVNKSSDNSGLQIRLQHLNGENQSLHEDLQRIGVEIAAKTAKLRHTSKKAIQFGSLTEDLTAIEQEKARILRNIEHNRLEILSIVRTINSRQSGVVLIPLETPGYLFYKYDEYEAHFSPDRFKELRAEDFNRAYSLKLPDKRVKAGAVIAKVIQPFHQLITFISDPKQSGLPEPGDIWWFKSGDNIFQCPVVDRIRLNDGSGKIIVALDDVSMLPEFMPNRRAKIFIIYKHVSGIIIPVQALYKRG